MDMMRRATAVITVMLMLTISLSGCLWEEESEDSVKLISFSEDRVEVQETNLYGIGPRLTGTQGEYDGANYIMNEFITYGLSYVAIEEYDVTCYEVNSAEFSLVQYNPTTGQETDRFDYIHMTEFILQGYSGSRVHNDRLDDLEIVDVGNGSDEALYADAGGKAVIVTSIGDMTFTELFIRAWENGAEANIIHNEDIHEELGYHPLSFSASTEIEGHMAPLPDAYPPGQGPDIPSFMVSDQAGQDIKTKLSSQTINQVTGESNVKVQIDFDVTIETRPLNVVVGEVTGSSDGLVLIGAHHDSVYVTGGAQDNTCGVATLLEMAKNMAGSKPKRTIRFATWGGEEEALMGSWEYIKAHPGIIDELKVYINLDMVNVELSRNRKVTMGTNNGEFTSKLKKVQKAVVDKYSWAKKYDFNYYEDNLTGGSDQASFALEGGDAVVYWGSGSVGYHTPLDDLSHIYKESLMLAGIILGSFALLVAG
jgi:hypothetical protein